MRVLLFAGVAYWSLSLAATAADDDPLRNFFVGRVQFSKNDGRDCGDVGRAMAKLVAEVSTIPVQNERKVPLRGAALFDTPFLFMNGHRDFKLSAEERANLKTYFERGGFLFASGCCTNPAFPAAWRREFSQILDGEKVQSLAYGHPIYAAFYKIDGVRSLHTKKDVHLEGLFSSGRLTAVLCEEGLCCAFSMNNRCNKGRGVAPSDARKLALNIAVYAMTH